MVNIGPKSILDRVQAINVWTRYDKRAVHKPLLFLLAVARLEAEKERLAYFSDLEGPLTSLLREFDNRQKFVRAEYPFWRLQSDGLWQVECNCDLKRRKGSNDPLRSELKRHNPRGGLPKDVFDVLRNNRQLLEKVVDLALSQFFPVESHERIRAAIRRNAMIGSTGRDLEDYGQTIFSRMGLRCFHRLNKSAKRSEVDPSGTHHRGENLEIDYLMPIGNVCFVGEITSRASKDAAEAKYGRFRSQFDIVSKGMTTDYRKACKAIGIPETDNRLFRNIKECRAFFIVPEHDRFSLDLKECPNVNVYYKPDWSRLIEYTSAIGTFAKFPFLDAYGLTLNPGKKPYVLRHKEHNLNRIKDRKIAADVGLADLFNFDADPYQLLPLARVFRRDDLAPVSERSARYQRALRPDKLARIREILKANPDFMFPNGILVVLSEDCEYDGEALQIADRFGAITVLDGQHRLFSYADAAIESLHTNGCIPVTAIKFIDATPEEIWRYSAITFVEINANQTRIPAEHIDAVNYSVLGRTTPDALAAAVLLKANERAGKPLFGLFRTAADREGVIQPRTVIKSLGRILNLEVLKRLSTSTRLNDEPRRRGFEGLLGQSLSDLIAPDKLVQNGLVCFERFFSLVKTTFKHDWPQRGAEKSLRCHLQKSSLLLLLC